MDENPTNPNITPVEPQEPVPQTEEQPLAPEPTTVPPVAQEPIASQVPTEPTNSIVEPQPKKKKTGLIIGLIIALLFLGGAIVLIFLLSDSPEKNAQIASGKLFDTMSAIISPEASTAENKNIKVDGKIDLSVSSDYGDSGNINANFSLEANDNAEARALVNLNFDGAFKELYGDTNIDLEAREISKKNPFVKLDGISDLVENISNNNYYYGSTSDFSSIIDKIDGKWIEIDLEETMEEMSNLTKSLSNGLLDESTNAYLDESNSQRKCLTNELNVEKITSLINPSDLAEALSLVVYNGNAKTVEKGTIYTLKINAEGTAKFFNNYYQKYQELLKDALNKCDIEDNTLTNNNYEFKAEDIEEYIDKLPEIFVVINNKEITQISTTYSQNNVTASIELNISYPKSIEIKEPETSTPLSKLYTDMMELLVDSYSYDDYDFDFDDDDDDLEEDYAKCLKENGYDIKTYTELYDNDEAYDVWWDKC